MQEIKNYIRESRTQEVDKALDDSIKNLNKEGFTVEFGKIGTRTTYALLYNKGYEKEFLGYTFIKDVKFYKENVGKLRALQQAIARKEIAESKTE